MVERVSSLAGLAPVSGLVALPPATRISLRSSDASALGIAGGGAINTAVVTGATAALHLGPDEWLVIAPEGQGEALMAGAAVRFASAVDVSHRSVGIEVSGAHATDILAAFVALDLAEVTFPVGMATRTLFGKAEIIIWRTGAETFRIEVWRSFAPYVWQCLEEAGREFI